MAQAPARVKTAHPLQTLSVDELTEAVAIIQQGTPDGGWDPRRFRFVEVALQGAAKADYLAAAARANSMRCRVWRGRC